MQVGDVLLIQGKGLIAKWIQRLTGSCWTHTAICLGEGYILEIDWNKKAAIVLNSYIQEGYNYVLLTHQTSLSLSQKKEIVYAALRFHLTGNRYDWLLLFDLFIKIKFPHLRLSRMFNQKNSFICTELVDSVLHFASVYLFPDRNGDIFPQDFLLCKQLYIIDSSKRATAER